MTDRFDLTGIQLRLAPGNLLVIRPLRHSTQAMQQVCHQSFPVLPGKLLRLPLDVSQSNQDALLPPPATGRKPENVRLRRPGSR